MKHHEYQIYYGGFKNKIESLAYCYDCSAIVASPEHKILIKLKNHKTTKVQQSSIPKRKGYSPIARRKPDKKGGTYDIV